MRPSAGRDRSRLNPIQRLYGGLTTFDFINRWKIWFACSTVVIVLGLGALAIGGLNFSIDFRGGSLWQVPTTASVSTVRADMAKISPLLTQNITQLTNPQTGQKTIQVEAPASITGDIALVNQVTKSLAKTGGVLPNDVTAELIGPSWGSSISKKAIEAVVVFLVLISIAISLYFEAKMAIGALIALLHDILITVGIYALSGFQVSPDTVIAFLTVMGYSLYDTIVVFDKVKENTKGLASTNRYTYTDVVNLSMNQVMARSVNTSFVAIMPVFCILVIGAWILGASALNDFGLALFIGLMSGAYSSIFIASPILALLKEREPRYVEIRRRLAAYPQSRQILTASMVADGALVGPRVTVGQSMALSTSGAAAGSGRSLGRPSPGAGQELASPPPGLGTSRALAPAATGGPLGPTEAAPAPGLGAGNEFESYAGAVRPRSARGGDRTSSATTSSAAGTGTTAGGNGAPAEPVPGAEAEAPAETPAGAAASKVPPRPAGPRPRKKQAPRRR